ncbi:MAG: sigma-70 family RNA polymerase sigma factor [candidate division WOR-3 bacterium]
MDPEAFASIVEETKSFVLKAIRENLFSEYYYAIDDVVQETYIRAYKSLIKNKFRKESKLSSWLYTIAKNESIRMNRKLSSTERRREKYAERTLLNFESSVEEKIEKKELFEILNKAIGELPGDFKEVMNLYIRGFTEKEMVKILSLPKGTIKSRIHRGKAKLKELLKEEL